MAGLGLIFESQPFSLLTETGGQHCLSQRLAGGCQLRWSTAAHLTHRVPSHLFGWQVPYGWAHLGQETQLPTRCLSDL